MEEQWLTKYVLAEDVMLGIGYESYFVCAQVDWVREHMEKAVPVKDVFQQNEVIDVVGVTKGKGFKGQSCCLANEGYPHVFSPSSSHFSFST